MTFGFKTLNSLDKVAFKLYELSHVVDQGLAV